MGDCAAGTLLCCTQVANWDGCVRDISKTIIVKVVLVLTWTKMGWPKLGWGIGSTGSGVLLCLWAQQWSGSAICRWWRCTCSCSDAWSHSGVFGGWYLMNITMSVWHRSNHNNYWHIAQNTELVTMVWDFKANRILGFGMISLLWPKSRSSFLWQILSMKLCTQV